MRNGSTIWDFLIELIDHPAFVMFAALAGFGLCVLLILLGVR